MTDTLANLIEIGAFAMCAVIVWTGVRLLLVTRAMRRAAYILRRTRLPDEPLPEALLPIEAELRGLGFIPARRMQYRLAYEKKPLDVWTYNHPELHIEASLTPTPATRPPFLAAFETTFADDALLVTWYPRGQTLDAPDLIGRFAQHSIHEAFDHHLLTQMRWTELHGEARPIPEDDAVYLAAAENFNARHSRTLYMPLVRHLTGHGIARFGYALVLLAIVFTMRSGSGFDFIDFDFTNITAVTLMLLLGLLLAVGGGGYASKGKPPVAVDADRAPEIDPKLHPLNRPERTI